MGAIIDSLYLGEKEIGIVREKYPSCQIFIENPSELTIQKYRIIIPDEEEMEPYYIFLLDNGIAMSSRSFVERVTGDAAFSQRMRQHVSRTLEALRSKYQKAS